MVKGDTMEINATKLGASAATCSSNEASVAQLTGSAAREAGCSDEAIAQTDEKLRQILVAQGRLEDGTSLEDAVTSADYTFASNVASQVGGAELSDERRKPESDQDDVMAKAARARDWKARLAGMSHDDRVADTVECFSRRRQYAAVTKDLLVYCREERALADVEAHIRKHANYEKNHQSEHQYILFMQRTGALEEREYDSDGLLITDSMRRELFDLGATEEELEDLTVEWRYLTTDVGEEALCQDDPMRKFKKLFAAKATRKATYKRVIDFCETPRSMDEIFQFLKGDPGLEVNAQGIMGRQPSAYVSSLEDAGVLVWREGGWRLTKAGAAIMRMLAT